jgi:CheY-like chemotaxis protein
MKMLIVEDEPVQRTILAQVFRGEGHHVRAFCSSGPAVEIVRSWQPEIVICDLELPGESGEEVAAAADALPYPAWIILLSVDRQRLESARSIADIVLRKPFHLVELVKLVEQIRSTESSRGPGSRGAQENA